MKSTALRLAAIAGWFLLTRAIALGATHAGARFMTPETKAQWTWEGRMPGTPPGPFLAPIVRWDAHFYVAIAREGYPHWKGDRINYTVAFFPLYPLLVRGLAPLAGDEFRAAFLISNLATLLAAFATCAFAARVAGPQTGVRASILLLASPGAHFLAYPYPEGLFVLLLGCAFLLIAARRPLTAALCGALASATRSAGIAVAVALAVSAFRHRDQWRAASVRVVAAVASLAGIAAFAAFCHREYGDTLAFFHVQEHFGRALSPLAPVRAFARFEVDPDYYVVAIAAIAIAAVALRRRADENSVSAALLVLLPLSSGTLRGMIRYVAANVPLLASAAEWLSGRRFALVLAASLALMAVEAFLYGKGIGHY